MQFFDKKHHLKIIRRHKMANHSETFMNRVTQALSRPIQTRCAELTVLFDKGSTKDTHNIFPVIVDNIFGPQSSFSWELRSITEVQNFQDFRTLQHFLSPHGPMFRLIYNLLKDPQIKYEFSLSYLPTKIHQNLDSTVSHPFYAEILNINSQAKQVISLTLNPFDYYIFHFAYHLINPWHQRLSTCISPTFNCGSVYFNLCCDYIMHFLPTDPRCAVLPAVNYYVGKNPIQALPTFVRPVKISKLFRPSVLADAVNEMNTLNQPTEQHPRSHIWRSETVLIVFVDMWLNNDQVIMYEHSLSFSKFQQQFQFNELPTAEYIRIVRVLIKKLHAFSASAKIDDTYMNELKKIAIPYMQGKMYVFLRNLIHRWPLDGSFRLVLELWLSFIQPWRYSGNEYLESRGPSEIQELDGSTSKPAKVVDREYLPFIIENILAYIVIFQQLLPRFAKVDLSSPKIALMLYRMLKVMGQPNLIALLREIEGALDNINTSPSHVRWMSSVPPLSPTSNWCSTNTNLNSTNYKNQTHHYSYTSSSSVNSFLDSSVTYRGTGGRWSNIVKQKIAELESVNFCYKALFASEPAQEVFDLIWHIEKGKQLAKAIIRLRKEEENKNSKGFFGFLRMVFTVPDYSNDEFSLEERTKVPIILDFSLEFLTNIFQIRNLNTSTSSKDDAVDMGGLYTQINKNDFPYLLTPERVRERFKNLKYEGDPDLQPIRSDENTFLVRIFYQLSKKINEEFGHHLTRLYYEQSFTGKIFRELLTPPTKVYRYEKSENGRSPRVEEHLPPRITLRPLARHKFLTYIALGAILFHLFGYGTTSYIFSIFSLWCVAILFKVLIPKRIRQESCDSPRRLLNLSLNDSFN